MRVDLSSNLREVIPAVDLLFNDQLPFAMAKALTDTAKAVAKAMPSALQQDLDRPSDFTRAGFFVTPARKDDLQSAVGIKDAQAKYLQWQIEGGNRAPARKAQRLPGTVQLDAFGNIPRGLIAQLVARALAGRRTTKRQAQKSGVSQGLDLYYGDPDGVRPPGIYKRVTSGGRSHLVPVVVFPAVVAKYRPRFDFYKHAGQVVDATFDGAMVAAFELAMATKR